MLGAVCWVGGDTDSYHIGMVPCVRPGVCLVLCLVLADVGCKGACLLSRYEPILIITLRILTLTASEY